MCQSWPSLRAKHNREDHSITAVNDIKELISQRLIIWPNHPVYQLAEYQVKLIGENLNADGELAKDDFGKVTIGRVCAYELEAEDEEFCEVIYKFLGEIRPADFQIP